MEKPDNVWSSPSPGYLVGEANRQSAVTYPFIYPYTYALEIAIITFASQVSDHD